MNGFRMTKWHPSQSTSVNKLYFWQKNAPMIKKTFLKNKSSIYKYKPSHFLIDLIQTEIKATKTKVIKLSLKNYPMPAEGNTCIAKLNLRTSLVSFY